MSLIYFASVSERTDIPFTKYLRSRAESDKVSARNLMDEASLLIDSPSEAAVKATQAVEILKDLGGIDSVLLFVDEEVKKIRKQLYERGVYLPADSDLTLAISIAEEDIPNQFSGEEKLTKNHIIGKVVSQ